MSDTEKPNYHKALIAVLLAAILGGSMPVFSKIALKEIPPLSFTFLRFFFASLFILPLFIREKEKFNKTTGKVILISFLATANVVLFAYGVRLTTATISQTLYTGVPILAMFLSYLLLREKLTSKKLIGVFLGFIGALIVVLLPVLSTVSSVGNLQGNLLISVALISFTLYTVFAKKLQKQFSPIYLTSIFIFTTAVLQIFLMGIETYTVSGWWNNVSFKAIISTLYVSFIGTIVYYLLYQYAIKHGTPLIASMVLYLQPVSTFFWAFLLLGESITTYFIVGAVLIFIGAGFVTRTK